MSRGKDLLKNTAIVSIGKLATQLITFFLLPLYTAVLSSEEYGVVDLLNTLTNLFLPIATLQIEQGIFRYLIDYRENKEKQTTIITTIMRFLIVQTIIYLTIFLVVSPFINNVYKYFLSANLIMCMFSTILLQICRGLGDNKGYAIGSFISGTITVVLNVIFIVAFKWGAYGMLAATALGNLLCSVYILIKNRIFKFIKPSQYDKALQKEILKYSMPLIPNMISWWIVASSNRTIISAFLSIAKNGIYSAASKFSGLFTTLYSVFNMTWTESASININSEDKDTFFSKMLDITIRLFGAMAIGIIAVMPFAFPILINEKFAEGYGQIPILMVGSMFNVLVSFTGSIYVAKKITKEIAKTSVFAAIINITITLVLIKYIGLYAASIATLVAYMAMFIYRYIDSKKYVKLQMDKKLLMSMILVLALVTIAYYMDNWIIQAGSALIAAIYAIFINRNSVKFVCKIVFKK